MTNLAAAKNLAVVAVLALGTVAVTGCSAETANATEATEEGAPEEVATTTQAVDNGSGGAAGYSCTDSGFCQCKGLADCNDMFLVCKSHVYCNQDAQGLRCSCLNFVLRTGAGRLGGARAVDGTLLTK